MEILVPKYAVTIDVSKLVVTDITGAYDASTNPGGWGGTNQLDESAVWAVVTRKASTGDEFFEPVASQIIFDNAALNTKETEFEFEFINDGVLEVVLGMLKASTDGINYAGGGAIGEGEIFYWSNAGTLIWKMVSGTPEVVEINDLVGDDNVVQTLASDILLPRLAVQKQALYKEYTIKRDTRCDDAQELFDELQKLSQDIQGAIYAYYSGLTVQAQDQVETMLDRYKLLNQ
jgi:hypothetical protein